MRYCFGLFVAFSYLLYLQLTLSQIAFICIDAPLKLTPPTVCRDLKKKNNDFSFCNLRYHRLTFIDKRVTFYKKICTVHDPDPVFYGVEFD